ncbi:hypothetical protein DBR43_00695 [Pedobacter sp. KBW06]|uniref:hypothetical protein n=1 Tax=Pedobacter sp. KBW06 TaxID=2153359 RepID=UPI000F58FE9D|nr:hypothetical protein [Pedobacter sp. KBW06]RQO73958.1 hypothetical protein DBR43_00695 [Pedobacter sp. KBW06]
MKINIKNLTRASILFAALVSLNSCKKENDNKSINNSPDVSVQDGRILFKNSDVLRATVTELTNKNTAYLDAWENNKQFSSLRRDTTSAEDLQAFNFPQFFSTFINPNGEYMVGDTIVWYHNGLKHMVPNKDEALLARIKANQGLSKIKYTAGSEKIKEQEIKESVQSRGSGKVMQVVLGGGAVDARYQKEFTNDWGHPRKIVIEIYNYVEAGPIGYNSYLITRIKQYWKGKSTWKPAGEAMKKYITNLSYTKGYHNVFNGAYVEVSGTVAAIPASGPQIDGNNLEYMIASTISSNTTTAVRVTGNYEALVVAPYNSQGFYNVAADW